MIEKDKHEQGYEGVKLEHRIDSVTIGDISIKSQKINRLMDAAWNMFSDLRKNGLSERQALRALIKAMLKKLSKTRRDKVS